MNAFTLRYEVIDSSSLDYAEYSLCPACSLRIIKLVDGCSVCGWSEEDKKLLGGLNKCSSKTNPPSTKTNKQRRYKGEGSGHIYYRTVTRNGKSYQQAYYQWREEDGKQRTKYIPKKLLNQIEEAEQQKYPVTKILEKLQGGLVNCFSKTSSTSTQENVRCINKTVETIDKCSSKNDSLPSKRRKRSSGYGGGYIEYREVKRNHKVYGQYWYHYEFWDKGDVVTKKSKYIPKRLVQKVERMNDDKVAVRKILEVLKGKNKK